METPPRFGVVLGVTTIRMLRALGGFGGTKELRELRSLLAAPNLPGLLRAMTLEFWDAPSWEFQLFG